ncbi:PH domain-containing protein [uncultured Parasphingorhabdus sp.]|uniref:PH domain-containing protein n=1 Tax=uncultured Parasphingorhabdus sp. TaxID=2709694 RepID=UPI0030D87073|tara:strand:- start:21303 stop:21848 length:546 start_codon:yes stop_codon:yes gene_type:complete
MTKDASKSSISDQYSAVEPDLQSTYNQGLTPLHPPQKNLIRVNMIIRSLVLLAVAVAGEILLHMQLGTRPGMILVPVAIFVALQVVVLPHRIYRRWGYDMGDEQLRVLRGFLWRTDTIVPFNRIQHIDVAQGPLQRLFGLSTLIVHTAGTHNSIVTLPGLATADAETMRETIKGHIRQDMI